MVNRVRRDLKCINKSHFSRDAHMSGNVDLTKFVVMTGYFCDHDNFVLV